MVFPVRALQLVFIGVLWGYGVAATDQSKDATGTIAPVPPREARRAFEAGEAAVKARRASEAADDFERAVRIFPGYAEAWCELGKERLESGQSDGARQAFDEAIRADSNYTDAYLMLAVLEQGARNWKRLVEVTDKLLRLDAIDLPQAWLLNAVGNYNSHNFEAAERSAREAGRLDSRQKLADARRLLGLILAQRGDFGGEVAQFREYLKMAPAGAETEAVRARLAEAERRPGGAADVDSSPTFRAETALAVVSFQVRGKGRVVTDLRAEDIEVREEGVAQKIALFEGGAVPTRSVPVEISLLFDCSASVDRIFAESARFFRDQLLDEFPNASIAVYGFSDDLARLSRPTLDLGVLKKAMDLLGAIPKSDTPLFGSIADTVRDASVTGANVIRKVVIFSDGESASFGDEQRVGEATRVANEAGAALFPVMLSAPSAAKLSRETMDSIQAFMGLASATGGREFQGLMGADVLASVLKGLANQIRSEYVAGFYVTMSGEPKRRHIEVVLHDKERWRIQGGQRTLVH